MREYLISAIIVSLLCAIVSALSPEGKMKKSISFALSAVLICVLISPLFYLITDFDAIGGEFFSDFEIKENGELENKEFEAQTQKAINLGIARDVSERFNIDEDNISVDTDIEIIGSEILFLKVDIFLKGRGAFADIVGIEKYIEKSMGTECEVRLLED